MDETLWSRVLAGEICRWDSVLIFFSISLKVRFVDQSYVRKLDTFHGQTASRQKVCLRLDGIGKNLGVSKKLRIVCSIPLQDILSKFYGSYFTTPKIIHNNSCECLSIDMQILSFPRDIQLTSLPILEEASVVSPCTFISTFLFFIYICAFVISPLNQL